MARDEFAPEPEPAAADPEPEADSAIDKDDEPATRAGAGATVAGVVAGAAVGATFGATHPEPDKDQSGKIVEAATGTAGGAATGTAGPGTRVAPPAPRTAGAPTSGRVSTTTGGPGSGGNSGSGAGTSAASGRAHGGSPESSGAVPSDSGPSGGRALGIGAAAGLGAAAAAGLWAAGGHSHPGTTTGQNVPGALHPRGPAAPPAASGGDQGFTPVSASSAPHSATPGSTAPYVTAPGSSASHAAPMTDAGTASPLHHPTDPMSSRALPSDPNATVAGHHAPIARSAAQATHPAGRHGQPTAPDPAVPAQVPGTGAVGQPGNTPTLYDSAGHPVMVSDGAGHWRPVNGGHGTGPSAYPGTDQTASPVLYDSTGHPVAMMDDTGHIVPLSANPVHPATENPPAEAQGRPPTGPGSTGDGQTTSVQTTDQGAPQMVPMTDAEVANMMLQKTPAERKAYLEQMFKDGNTDMPNGTKYWQSLPDSFYKPEGYTYKWKDDKENWHEKHMDSAQAAATVELLFDSFHDFKTEISALSDAARKAEAQIPDIDNPARTLKVSFGNAAKMWTKLTGEIGQDAHIAAAATSFANIRAALVGGNYTTDKICGTTSGMAHAASQSIQACADRMRFIAAWYVYTEKTNLSQFGMWNDNMDPRSEWDKQHFVFDPSKEKKK